MNTNELLEELSKAIKNGDLEYEDGCLTDRTRCWADDGNAEIEFPDDEHETWDGVAQAYVDGGDWGAGDGSVEVCVMAGYYVLDLDTGEIKRSEEATVGIPVHPDEPECDGEHEHRWSALGDDFDGVRGHGGGVTITKTCVWCGLNRTTDTWADNGHGGQMESVSYTPSGLDDAVLAEYRDEINAR